MSTYIIGDIHGCYEEFIEMLSLINFNDNDLLILIGDYIDRGKQNYEMIQWIICNYFKKNIILLKGNHEQEFVSNIDIMINIDKSSELNTDINSLSDTQLLYESCLYQIKQKNPIMLLYFDAYYTIRKLIYNNNVVFNELLNIREVFNNMQYLYEKNNIIAVHAGYIEDYNIIKDKYSSIEDFYLYAREDGYFLGGKKDGIIISGHSPTIEENDFCFNDGDIFHYYNKKINCHYYNIDGGIVFRKENPSSQLCCLRLEDKEEFYI